MASSMIINQYKTLIDSNRSLLGFGFMMTLYSSFGQTFFVGVFGPQIQSEFGLSHTSWGFIYMLGTLLSALALPVTGQLIDRYPLMGYSLSVCVLLAVACGVMAFVTQPGALVFAIFLLRHSGQGLATHVAITTMGRYFNRNRGRAIAIASLGITIGQAVLPLIAVAVMSRVGWRWAYGGVAAIIAVTAFPTILTLLRGHNRLHPPRLNSVKFHEAREIQDSTKISWSRKQVLRDARFYMLLPGIMAPGLIGTAFFFHHLTIADVKQWDAKWVTGNYIVYAAATVLAMIAAGPIVDLYRSQRVLPFALLPLAFAGLVIGISDHPVWIIPYMLLMGLHAGFAYTSASALWAELYGVVHLGAIKSMYAAIKALSSALGPIIMGGLVDLGIPIEHTCFMFAAYALAGTVMIMLALRPRGELN